MLFYAVLLLSMIKHASSQVNSTCNSIFQEFNSESNNCDCKQGFSGLFCQQCDSDKTCSSIQSTYCSKGLVYYNDVEAKNYECTLDDSLSAVLADGKVDVHCNQTASACRVAVFEKTVQDEHMVDCDATGCSFVHKDTNFNCDLIVCTCGPSCTPLIKMLVEGTLSNEPVKFEVRDGSFITLNIEGAPLPLKANCTASACSLNNPTGGGPSTTFGTNHESSLLTVIFLIVAILLAVSILACGCSVFLWERKSNFVQYENVVTPQNSARNRLSFHHISSHTNDPLYRGEVKTILNDISGSVNCGNVLALLGPSGAGKTSLLNALAGISNGSCSTSGEVLLDGIPRDESFRELSAFVHQDDALFSTLTVRESIEYSAFLRLPCHMPLFEKKMRASKILTELDLEAVAESRIGDATTRGISGGERRRVSIGMELVTSPKILFLDEPTSGLDSTNANSIISLLQALASHGRIVILSIHQPSAKALQLMDKILLLAKGGKIMYAGTPEKAVQFFKNAGHRPPKNENIADFMLDVVSEPNNIGPLESYYADHKEANAVEEQNTYDDDDDSCDILHFKRSLLWETNVLFQRTSRNLFRHRSLFFMHVLISILLATFTGLLFANVTPDLAGFQNRTGALYFVLTFFGFASFSSIDLFLTEREIFSRETGARYYSPFSYFIAKMTMDTLTLRVLPATLFASIFYWIMGLQNTSNHFFVFLITLILFNVAAGSLSVCISIYSSTAGAANLTATFIFLIMLLFGGFLLNIDTLPGYIKWLRYTSIFYYAFEILLTNELDGIVLSFDAPNLPAVPVNGDVFLETLGLKMEDQLIDIVALVMIIILLNALAYILLTLRVPSTAQLRASSSKQQELTSM